MFGIDAHIYPYIYQWGIFAICLFICWQYSSSDSNLLLLKENSSVGTYFFVLFLILFIGLRPVSYAFGDTGNYAKSYRLLSENSDYSIDFSKEWLFATYKLWCVKLGLDVKIFFLGIEVGYMGLMFWAMRKILWENTWVGMLFWFSAYSTFTYGVNGLRNGLACSIIVLAMVFASKDKNYVVAALLAFLATGIHRSAFLPIAATLGTLLFLKTTKWALWFWLLAIPISVIGGDAVTNLFMGFGFDDRADAYLSGGDFATTSFSYTGFRWDFLLYSSMPVLLIWYVQKRVAQTGGYRPDGSTALADAQSMRVWNTLATTYLLCNAFWIMVIRAGFSNRFAYLSWFLYPIVLAYGFVRLHIWDDQDKRCAWALLAHTGFTMIMFLLGKI